MAITTASADNVFKRYYLSAVTDQLNMNVNPFLARIRQSTNNVYGREIRKLIHYGVNGGISAGSEDGELAPGYGSLYSTFTLPLKNLYGNIEISDKAIRASANNEGAFVNLLDEEMQNLIKSASYNLSRMLFGDGTGLLGTVSSVSANTITVDDAQMFTEGMLVDLYSSGVLKESAVLIRSVNRDKNILTVNKLLTSIEGYKLYPTGSHNNELTGLGSIFGGANIYGLGRTDNAFLQPYKKTVETLTEDEIQLAIDKIEEKSGGKPNFIICSWGVRRALIKLLKANHSFVETLDLEGGYKAISFNGIPVVVDRFCPKGTMYILNTDDFVLYQLCDWQWLEDEGGRVLRQIPGRPVYTATLVKYADLLCERPCGQAMLSGITEE